MIRWWIHNGRRKMCLRKPEVARDVTGFSQKSQSVIASLGGGDGRLI